MPPPLTPAPGPRQAPRSRGPPMNTRPSRTRSRRRADRCGPQGPGAPGELREGPPRVLGPRASAALPGAHIRPPPQQRVSRSLPAPKQGAPHPFQEPLPDPAALWGLTAPTLWDSEPWEGPSGQTQPPPPARGHLLLHRAPTGGLGKKERCCQEEGMDPEGPKASAPKNPKAAFRLGGNKVTEGTTFDPHCSQVGCAAPVPLYGHTAPGPGAPNAPGWGVHIQPLSLERTLGTRLGASVHPAGAVGGQRSPEPGPVLRQRVTLRLPPRLGTQQGPGQEPPGTCGQRARRPPSPALERPPAPPHPARAPSRKPPRHAAGVDTAARGPLLLAARWEHPTQRSEDRLGKRGAGGGGGD
ncbi:uncharacterized protein C6orf132-like [Dasypus novemcinctus]|uniref:uncharacterized protein C6orf132-like n=1 Tax=Dasypus novemcinctus TaxID=9361 RepID=UPI00265DCDC8|nr:basic proline-rich protein-like [Dasypus novemcinctus]